MTEKTETIGDMPHAQKIMEKIKENPNSWRISRVPPKTKQTIIELADAEFCGDRGMVLKWLVDDMICPDTKILIDSITALEARVADLEFKLGSALKTEPEDNTISMCDGSKRIGRGKE